MKEWKAKGYSLPKSHHEFCYADMGIADEGVETPIPDNVYDARCPHCNSGVHEEFTETMLDEDCESGWIDCLAGLKDRFIACAVTQSIRSESPMPGSRTEPVDFV